MRFKELKRLVESISLGGGAPKVFEPIVDPQSAVTPITISGSGINALADIPGSSRRTVPNEVSQYIVSGEVHLGRRAYGAGGSVHVFIATEAIFEEWWNGEGWPEPYGQRFSFSKDMPEATDEGVLTYLPFILHMPLHMHVPGGSELIFLRSVGPEPEDFATVTKLQYYPIG